MNSDIRLDIEFWQHIKTRLLIRALGPWGAICLQKLWCYAAKHRPNGILRDMDAAAIEMAAEWPDERAGEFFAYTSQHRWLDPTEDGWYIHEWVEYNAWAADAPARQLHAKKAAHKRYHKKHKRPGVCDFCTEEIASKAGLKTSMPAACSEHARTNFEQCPTTNTTTNTTTTSNTRYDVDSTSTSSDDVEKQGVLAAIREMAPHLVIDEGCLTRWLALDPDPWHLAAILCEKSESVRTAKSPAYLDRVISEHAADRIDNPQEYVTSYALASMRRQHEQEAM